MIVEHIDYSRCWQAAGKAFDYMLVRARECNYLSTDTEGRQTVVLHGIPRGGIVPMFTLRENASVYEKDKREKVHVYTRCTPSQDAQEAATLGLIIVDDIVDTGETIKPYLDAGCLCVALFQKESSPLRHENLIVGEILAGNPWVKFFWEVDEADDGSPEQNVRRLLSFIGEDPKREGLVNTPKRVCRALKEMTSGYSLDAKEILATQFECASDNIVICRDIRFSSMCEHHLLPFSGTAHVGYLPGVGVEGKVVGLSKLARLVDCFANRLQLQERMTSEIAEALMENIEGICGAGVIVTAHHSCMGCRGVKKHDASMVTSSMLGRLRESPETRAEFLALCKM